MSLAENLQMQVEIPQVVDFEVNYDEFLDAFEIEHHRAARSTALLVALNHLAFAVMTFRDEWSIHDVTGVLLALQAYFSVVLQDVFQSTDAHRSVRFLHKLSFFVEETTE